MNIRMKSFSIIGAASLVLILGLMAISNTILMNIIKDEEAHSMDKNIGRAMEMLSHISETMAATSEDWAAWNSAYKFVQGGNEGFIFDNLVPSTFRILKLNLMVFVDESSQIVYGKGFDLDNSMMIELPDSLRFYLLLFSVCMTLVFLVSTTLMQKIVVSRLEYLNKFINDLVVSKDTSSRLQLKGKDEISNLAVATNTLLSELSRTYGKLSKREERLKLVLEATNDGFWDWDLSRNEIYYSQRYLDILGYKLSDIRGNIKKMKSLIHPDDFPRVEEAFEANLRGDSDFLNAEYRMLTKYKDWKWVLSKCKVVRRDEYNNPLRMSGTLTDITDQKLAEERIKYLTFNDKLTGLNNRLSFETELEKIGSSSNLPVTIIMGDLNGLKMANDIFGHHEGDRLLCETSKILREVCKKEDFVARWGGDEFVMILYDMDETNCTKICENIRVSCNNVKDCPVKPSIALGVATMYKNDQSIVEVLQEAEKRMYRNKLLESKSTRNAIISSLLHTLYEKNTETQEHAKRLSNMCLKLGRSIGLVDNELDQLVLLASLHDIGKIAVLDEILNKPSDLSAEEWEAMKSHTEIGYRIAQSTPELVHIAEAILTHHEKYDGTGYPLGLKGLDIPVISRILSIADAYDVMINKRPYKAPFSKEEALKELKRCAGTQFDPHLVDTFIQLIA